MIFENVPGLSNVVFSRHAQKQMEARGILWNNLIHTLWEPIVDVYHPEKNNCHSVKRYGKTCCVIINKHKHSKKNTHVIATIIPRKFQKSFMSYEERWGRKLERAGKELAELYA